MAKLRAINKGTRYDITGNLRRLVRRIESGEIKDLNHVMVGVSCHALDGSRYIETWGAGTVNVPEMAYTVEMMRRRVVGQ